MAHCGVGAPSSPSPTSATCWGAAMPVHGACWSCRSQCAAGWWPHADATTVDISVRWCDEGGRTFCAGAASWVDSVKLSAEPTTHTDTHTLRHWRRSECRYQCQYVDFWCEPPLLPSPVNAIGALVPCEQNCLYSRRLKAASVEFHRVRKTVPGGRTSNGKSPRAAVRNDLYCVEWGVKLYSLTYLPPYVSSPWRGKCSRFRSAERRCLAGQWDTVTSEVVRCLAVQASMDHNHDHESMTPHSLWSRSLTSHDLIILHFRYCSLDTAKGKHTMYVQ